MVSENAADLVVLAELIESGKVTPVIDRTYPLSEAPGAIRYLNKATPAGRSSSPFDVFPVTGGRSPYDLHRGSTSPLVPPIGEGWPFR